MVQYSDGKIYKIIDNTNGSLYIGSTAEPTLARRLAKHRSAYKSFLNSDGKNSNLRSFQILRSGDFKIVLIEDYPCETRDQLLSREQYWMDKTQCVNHQNAKGHDSKNYQKFYQKVYRQVFKEQIKVKAQEWRGSNPDYNKNLRAYQRSFGGETRYNNNSLLKIDLSIFD